MKKTLLEKTLLNIFIDYEDGELPDQLDEWIKKYIPVKNRIVIKNEDRCIANTHKHSRCIKRIYKKSESDNKFCYQHNIIFTRKKYLQYGIYQDNQQQHSLNNF